jgi:hypothetical protein
VKKWRIDLVAAGAAVFLLAACGSGASTDSGTAADGGEAAAAAQSRDWIPAALVLPQPNTVLQETRLGTRTHLLQILVSDDPSPLLASWKAGLEAEGYQINDSLIAEGRLLFDGGDVESGQIAVLRPDDEEGYMIQVDVSRNAN